MAFPPALRSRQFAFYVAANGIGFIAIWMYKLALGWTIWERTGSGFWLGLVALCDLGPALLLGPLGGVLGDRGHPERVIACSQATFILALAALAASAFFEAPPWLLLTMAVITGGSVGLADAGRVAIVTRMVPASQAAPAVALNAVMINVTRFVGPALAGVIALSLGMNIVFVLAAILGIPLLVFVRRTDLEPLARSERHLHLLGELSEALAYVGRHRVIGLVLLNFLVACVFSRGVYELLPGLTTALFDHEIGGVSAMTTAIGLGAVGAGLLLSINRSPAVAAASSFAGAILASGATAALSFIQSFALALAIAALLGFAMSLCAISSQVVVQLHAEHSMRSRVLSLWSVTLRAGPAVGALSIGSLADRFGFRVPLAVAGTAGVVLAIVIWIGFSLMKDSWKQRH